MKEPESDWRVVRAGIPVYFLFPNVELAFLRGTVALIRIYPRGEDPTRSYSKVSYYRHDQNVSDSQPASGEVLDSLELAERFASVIDGEDYPAALSTYAGACAYANGYFLVGRNEPPVQHFHEVLVEALDMEPLERLEVLDAPSR